MRRVSVQVMSLPGSARLGTPPNASAASAAEGTISPASIVEIEISDEDRGSGSLAAQSPSSMRKSLSVPALPPAMGGESVAPSGTRRRTR